MKWYESVLEHFMEQQELIRRRSAQGIEQARKGDARLVFVNAAGDAVSNVQVQAKQKTHDFKFGCTTFPLGGFDTEEKNRRFEEEFAHVFNLAVCPFFWDTLEPVQGQPRYAADSPKIPRRPAPDLVCDFAEKYGIRVKGHALVYCGHAPSWIPDDIPTYKRLLEKHIAELAERYADRVADWDVVNESLHWFEKDNAYMRSLPLSFHHSDGYVEWCMNTARKYFPNNRLFINEGDPMAGGCYRFGYERQPFFLQLKLLRLEGIEPDAAGLMHHIFCNKEKLNSDMFDAENMYEMLDYWTHFGMKLNLSELTVPAYSENEEDEEFQKLVVENYYRIWFGHPAIDSIVWWNMADGTAYFDKTTNHDENRYHQGLLRRDFTRKPAYQVLDQMINKEWHTECEGSTGSGNTLDLRGFFGTYDLTITHDGKTETRTMHLSEDVRHTRGVHKIVL